MLEKPDNKIVSGGDPVELGEPGVAAEAITPGELVEMNSSGKIQKHSTAGETPLGIAVEHEVLTGDIATDYDVDDPVVVSGLDGAKALLWLASGENVDAGTELVSDGAGKLVAKTGHTHTENDTGGETDASVNEEVVGVALEGVDASGSAKRIHVLAK